MRSLRSGAILFSCPLRIEKQRVNITQVPPCDRFSLASSAVCACPLSATTSSVAQNGTGARNRASIVRLLFSAKESGSKLYALKCFLQAWYCTSTECCIHHQSVGGPPETGTDNGEVLFFRFREATFTMRAVVSDFGANYTTASIPLITMRNTTTARARAHKLRRSCSPSRFAAHAQRMTRRAHAPARAI